MRTFITKRIIQSVYLFQTNYMKLPLAELISSLIECNDELFKCEALVEIKKIGHYTLATNINSE